MNRFSALLAVGLVALLQKLRDLDPPDGSEDELEATVKAIERGADNFREASSALAGGNQEALTKVSKDLKTSLGEISETGQALETSVKN